jgi:hypothetical protein
MKNIIIKIEIKEKGGKKFLKLEGNGLYFHREGKADYEKAKYYLNTSLDFENVDAKIFDGVEKLEALEELMKSLKIENWPENFTIYPHDEKTYFLHLFY